MRFTGSQQFHIGVAAATTLISHHIGPAASTRVAHAVARLQVVGFARRGLWYPNW